MILLIDAGNSRIKWRLQCASKGRVEAEGALSPGKQDHRVGPCQDGAARQLRQN